MPTRQFPVRPPTVSQQQLAALLLTSTDAVAFMDRNGLVSQWNPAAEDLLGWSRVEVLGRPVSRWLSGEAREAYLQAWATLSSGEPKVRLSLVTSHAGEALDLQLDFVAVPEGRPFEGALLVMTAHSSAGSQRDQAGDERDKAGEEGDLAGTRRDLASDRRDTAGERRDEQGTARDEQAGSRDVGAGHRDALGMTRDQAGEHRDAAGDARDVAGLRRDLAADLRDRAAEDHEAGRAPKPGSSVTARRAAADDRRQASLDRGAGAQDRTESGRDRRNASADRNAGADRRIEAEHDRSTALGDRSAGAVDRQQARADRRTAMTDRGTGASARFESEADRESAFADRLELEREREHASVDDLTGCYRREAGFAELDREIARARRTGQQLVVAFADVDGLKLVNDAHGHAAGDRLLTAVACALRSELRSHDVLIRYGGDEFVCVIPGLSIDQALERLALVDAMLARRSPPVSVTVGLAELRPDESATDVMARADAELYAARECRH